MSPKVAKLEYHKYLHVHELSLVSFSEVPVLRFVDVSVTRAFAGRDTFIRYVVECVRGRARLSLELTYLDGPVDYIYLGKYMLRKGERVKLLVRSPTTTKSVVLSRGERYSGSVQVRFPEVGVYKLEIDCVAQWFEPRFRCSGWVAQFREDTTHRCFLKVRVLSPKAVEEVDKLGKVLGVATAGAVASLGLLTEVVR